MLLTSSSMRKKSLVLSIGRMLWSYESNTKKANPLLHKIYHLPHGRTRRDTLDFSANTWDGDIIPFRQCLMRIEQYVDSFLFILTQAIAAD